MAMRMGLSVGSTTDVSSLADQVKRFRPRAFQTPIEDKAFDTSLRNNPSHEKLTAKCVKVIVANFEQLPVCEGTSAKQGIGANFLRQITDNLSIDLDPKIGALYVFDENYWKRRCVEQLGWQKCHLNQHGLSWKQLFFESHVAARIEAFTSREKRSSTSSSTSSLNNNDQVASASAPPADSSLAQANTSGTNANGASSGRGAIVGGTTAGGSIANHGNNGDTFEDLLAFLRCCQDYVFTVRVKQLLSHPNMQAVCEALPNLTTLDVTYGVKSIGMKYERMLFGMKISDAASLAKAIHQTPNLCALIFQGNLIDDDLLRMLMTGLIRNNTITYLDVSHNKITNHGARLLSKLLGTDSVLASLNLADNQIHAEGGRYLGRALRHNDSLVDLNLRLNRLTDDGGRMLLEGMRDSNTITNLNLSGSSIGHETATTLSIILRDSQKSLAVLDLSCNELGNDDMQIISLSLETNSSLVSLDLRMNDVSADLPELERIEELVHRNELARRTNTESKES